MHTRSRFPFRLLSLVSLGTLALGCGGCGPSARDKALEDRIAAAEAKANAAEVRAKRAEDEMLRSPDAAPSPDTKIDADTVNDADDPSADTQAEGAQDEAINPEPPPQPDLGASIEIPGPAPFVPGPVDIGPPPPAPV